MVYFVAMKKSYGCSYRNKYQKSGSCPVAIYEKIWFFQRQSLNQVQRARIMEEAGNNNKKRYISFPPAPPMKHHMTLVSNLLSPKRVNSNWVRVSPNKGRRKISIKKIKDQTIHLHSCNPETSFPKHLIYFEIYNLRIIYLVASENEMRKLGKRTSKSQWG